jgi:hypothetical protein
LKKEIWKSGLYLESYQVKKLPKDTVILSFQIQDKTPTIWYEKDFYNDQTEEWEFYIYGTGHAIEAEGIHYIGTVQRDGFVWHLYGRRK